MVTRRQIVHRELLVQKGDKYNPDLAAETARNLRARYPINDAWIELQVLKPGSLLVRVVTADEWSLSGGLRSATREAQETEYRFGVQDRNFLGRAQFVSLNYFVRQRHPNFVQFEYQQPRVWGGPWSLVGTHRSDPLDRLTSLEVARPYYSLAQSRTISLDYSDQSLEQRQLGTDGALLAKWIMHSDRFGVEAGVRGGPPYQKIGWSVSYLYSAVHTRDTAVYAGAPASLTFPIDTTYHLLSTGVTFQRLKYATEHRLQSFGYTEDIALGLQTGVSFGRAFLPDFGNHYYDLLIGNVNVTYKLGSNIISAGYVRSQWTKFSQTIRRLSTFDVLYYNNRLPFLTVAVQSHYETDRSGLLHPLVLGGRTGLRGYPTEFTAGSQLHVINTEARFFTGLEILSVKLGGALFSDIGRTWLPDEPMSIAGYHWNIGAGLRISLEHLRRGEIIRIDFVRLEDGTHEVSIDTGQYF